MFSSKVDLMVSTFATIAMGQRLAGKSTIEFDDFLTYKPSFRLGISQLAMFDNRRGT